MSFFNDKPDVMEMGDKSKISWTDATWNPVIGCSKVSAGCDNCYAEKVAARFSELTMSYGLAIKSGKWKGLTVRQDPKFNPLTARNPRTIFVCSMGDLFHSSVLDEWIDEVMAVIAMTPQHRYMILTKRPGRMKQYFQTSNRVSIVADSAGMMVDDGDNAHDYVINQPWPLPNLALGVSIEDQQTADLRIPILLQTPAAKRFISIEPMIGPVDLESLPSISGIGKFLNALNDAGSEDSDCPGTLDLVILGGESGLKARPMHPDWVRSVRDQCESSGVPFHFKQWGEYCYPSQMTEDAFRSWDYRHGTENAPVKAWRVGKKTAGHLLDGIEHIGSLWGEV